MKTNIFSKRKTSSKSTFLLSLYNIHNLVHIKQFLFIEIISQCYLNRNIINIKENKRNDIIKYREKKLKRPNKKKIHNGKNF